ncbi:MAG: GNAT family N-acetyltransferase [Chloroflexi bacterium]|nr:GNAT family N-acetyltransferase [Chloroflexota bacterium]
MQPELETAAALFERDRPWAAWPLCLLGMPDWPYVRVWIDRGDLDVTTAGLWTFDHPTGGGSLQTFGGGPALAALIEGAALPRRAFARFSPEARASLERRYRFDWIDRIVRMHITPETFTPPLGIGLARPLGLPDADALARLYGVWPESRFNVGRLRHGYRYWGIRQDQQLVAVAENVLHSDARKIAIVQGVLVDPAWRGHGLGRTVTAAMTAALIAEGARDVVLDVRESNAPAVAAYRRLGYRHHRAFLAGPCSHLPGAARPSFSLPKLI